MKLLLSFVLGLLLATSSFAQDPGHQPPCPQYLVIIIGGHHIYTSVNCDSVTCANGTQNEKLLSYTSPATPNCDIPSSNPPGCVCVETKTPNVLTRQADGAYHFTIKRGDKIGLNGPYHGFINSSRRRNATGFSINFIDLRTYQILPFKFTYED